MFSIIQQVQAVEEWFRKTDIYQQKATERQLVKYYATLGRISVGIDELDNLKVAAGIGESIWTFAALLHLGPHSNLGDVIIPLSDALASRTTTGTKEGHLHKLMSIAVETVSIVLREPEPDPKSYSALLRKLMRQYQLLACRCGLEFDRVVFNAHCKLVKTPKTASMVGDLLIAALPLADETPTEQTQPAVYNTDATVYDIIVSCLLTTSNDLQTKYNGDVVIPQLLLRMEDVMNEKLQGLLKTHFEPWVVRKQMLFNRNPRVEVKFDGNIVNICANDDLRDILNLLKGK
ncbi:hypothetical protein OHI49_002243 [Salmonella enterica]|uniref:hypothetical protein n=1 Tax=Salmonella enterica TaxID=28901 RepID=UPI0011221210|nr:hypothetical protein [Salmonella enterica]EDG6828939.1 hypothetical protein [Salmonella enterica subsp. enterica serovar Typhimurium]EDG8239083.1 hypothetical protein [Salmonella enterica subsp. enterica serovar Typhimurium]EDG8244146.1 hypothetical protein [Salmonella enterica subsp. enterica serovar Typhimurium]EDH0633837.1 hypothetical protein [Salmonella enterica subsp. enterica serovar Typhimurium]EJY7993345.1 hypothetical protein [Salmonella enterica]